MVGLLRFGRWLSWLFGSVKKATSWLFGSFRMRLPGSCLREDEVRLRMPGLPGSCLRGDEMRLRMQGYVVPLFFLFLGLIFTFFLCFFPCGQKGELCLYDKCVFWGTTMIREHIFTFCFLGGASSYIDANHFFNAFFGLVSTKYAL